MTELLTVRQAAKELGASHRQVQRWIAKGHFPNAFKLDPTARNSPFRIPADDIAAFKARRRD